jgi:hypothetical protein
VHLMIPGGQPLLMALSCCFARVDMPACDLSARTLTTGYTGRWLHWTPAHETRSSSRLDREGHHHSLPVLPVHWLHAACFTCHGTHAMHDRRTQKLDMKHAPTAHSTACDMPAAVDRQTH